MNYRMVDSSEIELLRASLQFLAYSEAYLDSAARLCTFLAKYPAESSFTRGAVVLHLSIHGIELFLKAAILEKVKDEKFTGNSGHDLEELCKRYANLYPGKKFAFEIPFGYEETVGTSLDLRVVEELNSAIAEHKKRNRADQINRYPRDIKGEQWDGPRAFEPILCAFDIEKVQQVVARLKELIFHCPGSA